MSKDQGEKKASAPPTSSLGEGAPIVLFEVMIVTPRGRLEINAAAMRDHYANPE